MKNKVKVSGIDVPMPKNEEEEYWMALYLDQIDSRKLRPFLWVSFRRWLWKTGNHYHSDRLFVEVGKLKIWTPFILIFPRGDQP